MNLLRLSHDWRSHRPIGTDQLAQFFPRRISVRPCNDNPVPLKRWKGWFFALFFVVGLVALRQF